MGHRSRLDSKQAVVVGYTDAMTKKVKEPEGVFEKIAAANAVNRFVVVLGVGWKRKRDRSA